MPPAIDDLPGFRRRIRIEPAAGEVTARLEDDYHQMTVTLRHDGETILSTCAKMVRAPWTTCPGAEQVVDETFTGTRLADAARRGLKQANCTHLYDLAVLAAAHAGEALPTDYAIAVSDPIDGRIDARLARDGQPVLHWSLAGMAIGAPAELAGRGLLELRDWIAGLDPPQREAAKLLQWGCLLAHGRQLPRESQSDATKMPPNCYTFQPDMARRAIRVGETIDFGPSGRQPLEAA
jgi:hypothetical protein